MNKLANKASKIPFVWIVHFNLVNIIVVTTVLFNIKYYYVVSKSLEYSILIYFILCLSFSIILKYKFINFLNCFKFRNALNILIFILILYTFIVPNFNSVSTVDDSISTYQARIHFLFQDIPFSWNSFSTYYNPILVYPMGSDNFVYWQYVLTQTFNNLYIVNALFFAFVGIITYKFIVFEKKIDTLLTKFGVVALILSPIVISSSKGVMQEGFTLFVLLSIFYYYFSPTLENVTNNSKILILFCLILEVLSLKPQYWFLILLLSIDFLKLLIQQIPKRTSQNKFQFAILLTIIMYMSYSNIKFGINVFIQTYNEHLSDAPSSVNFLKNFYNSFLQLITGSLFSILPSDIESFLKNYLNLNYDRNDNSFGFLHFPILFAFSSIIVLFFMIWTVREIKFTLNSFRFVYISATLFYILSLRDYSFAFHRYSLILLYLIVLVSFIFLYSSGLKSKFPYLWSHLNSLFYIFVFLSFSSNLNWYFYRYEQDRISMKIDRPYESRLIDFKSSSPNGAFSFFVNIVLHEQSRRECSKIILRTDQKVPISALIKYPSCDLLILKNTADESIDNLVISRQFRVINF
jgi:hypothetical protein